MKWKNCFEEVIEVPSNVFQDYKIYEEIETGKSNETRTAVHRRTGTTVAMKIIEK